MGEILTNSLKFFEDAKDWRRESLAGLGSLSFCRDGLARDILRLLFPAGAQHHGYM